MIKQVIHLSGRFLFEKGFESTPSFLVFNKQFGPEPLVCRTSQSQPEVVVGHSFRPVVSPHGFIDPGDELHGCGGVLGRFTEEI